MVNDPLQNAYAAGGPASGSDASQASIQSRQDIEGWPCSQVRLLLSQVFFRIHAFLPDLVVQNGILCWMAHPSSDLSSLNKVQRHYISIFEMSHNESNFWALWPEPPPNLWQLPAIPGTFSIVSWITAAENSTTRGWTGGLSRTRCDHQTFP